MTEFINVRTVYLVSVWLHVFAAVVWIGGMVFLAAVLVPTLRRAEPQSGTTTILHRILLRFRWVGWAALALLILTGLFNLGYRGYDLADLWTGAIWQGGFGQVLFFKLLLVALTLAMSVAHDFLLGPQTIKQIHVKPDAPRTAMLRWCARWVGRLTLVLVLLILWLAILLPRGGF